MKQNKQAKKQIYSKIILSTKLSTLRLVGTIINSRIS